MRCAVIRSLESCREMMWGKKPQSTASISIAATSTPSVHGRVSRRTRRQSRLLPCCGVNPTLFPIALRTNAKSFLFYLSPPCRAPSISYVFVTYELPQANVARASREQKTFTFQQTTTNTLKCCSRRAASEVRVNPAMSDSLMFNQLRFSGRSSYFLGNIAPTILSPVQQCPTCFASRGPAEIAVIQQRRTATSLRLA
jgi:hypothetical protein